MTRSRYDRGGRAGWNDNSRGDAARGGYGRGSESRSVPAAEGRDPYETYDRLPRGRRTAEQGGGGGNGGPGGGGGSGGGGGAGSPIQLNVGTIAVLAGVLVLGIGIGTALSSNTPGNQGNIASSQQLDLAVPDPEFCKQWGASAFVMDVELYTTMNPSSSFVTQPTLQPGCVIRRENWSVLQKEGAVTSEQMRQCKQRMNTFAYIGSIRDKPIVRCVYQTDISGNKFQTRGIAGTADDATGITPEAGQF
ncbi:MULTISPECIES: DUF3172 domain-containing protein [unclassified Synechococcus]|uniref:DUF3172 domain-containing protein n=1 Tax=unclassified Synechococcus TaxID=2626047 RepID=UPI0037D9A5E8